MRTKILLPFVAVLLVASCNQSPQPTPPVLTSPTEDARAAQAKVDATSGPVKLTLELYRTQVSASKERGYLFFRATIQNVGRESFSVDDPLFTNPYNMVSRTSAATYLEVRDSAGHAAERLFIPSGHDPATVLDNNLTAAQLESLRQAALHPGSTPSRPDTSSGRRLAPGESISTPEWSVSEVRPVKGFAQAPFEPLTPGNYTAKLVYDWSPTPDYKKILSKLGLKASPSNIRVETPPIAIKVLP